MKRLSKTDIRKIVDDYCKGLTYEAIAKKYGVSKQAVAKQLKKAEIQEKLTKVDKEVEESLRKKAHRAIKQIMDDLPDDLKKAPLRDKMQTLDRLREMFGLPEEEDTTVTGIVLEIEDASKDEEEN